MSQIPRSSFERVRSAELTNNPSYRYALDLLQAPERGGSQMVDVGCGACQMARLARDRGWEVTAVDAVPSNLDHARAFGFEAVQADFNASLPLPNDAFDHAMMVEVIEHIVNAEHLVGELGRIVKRGGRVLMTTPNNAYYKRRIRALQGKPPDDEGYHFRFFVKGRLSAMFEQRGFRLEQTRSFGFLPLVDVARLQRLRGVGRKRFVIPRSMESMFADRFVWLWRREG
jgi:2-polyprenyl-3-methyl-5-hydroxy-6-metoxy-1,4-benzoquinol methylase